MKRIAWCLLSLLLVLYRARARRHLAGEADPHRRHLRAGRRCRHLGAHPRRASVDRAPAKRRGREPRWRRRHRRGDAGCARRSRRHHDPDGRPCAADPGAGDRRQRRLRCAPRLHPYRLYRRAADRPGGAAVERVAFARRRGRGGEGRQVLRLRFVRRRHARPSGRRICRQAPRPQAHAHSLQHRGLRRHHRRPRADGLVHLGRGARARSRAAPCARSR